MFHPQLWCQIRFLFPCWVRGEWADRCIWPMLLLKNHRNSPPGNSPARRASDLCTRSGYKKPPWNHFKSRHICAPSWVCVLWLFILIFPRRHQLDGAVDVCSVTNSLRLTHSDPDAKHSEVSDSFLSFLWHWIKFLKLKLAMGEKSLCRRLP